MLAIVEIVAFTREAEGLCKLASEMLSSSDKLWTFPLSNFHHILTENCNIVRLDVLHTMMVCWHVFIHYLQPFVDMIANEGATIIGLPLHPEAL